MEGARACESLLRIAPGDQDGGENLREKDGVTYIAAFALSPATCR